MDGENIYRVAFNSIKAHVAILDDSGVIVETNRAWQEFARENGLRGPADCVGMNYLAFCGEGDPEGDSGAAGIARGIRQVMAGEAEEYFTRYPCHSPHEERWYALRAVRFRAKDKRQVVVSHENITPIMQAQSALEQKERQLIEQTRKLEDTNTALQVLLEKRDRDRQKLENNILANVQEMVLPYLDKLLTADLPTSERTMVEIAESRLRDIISPFMERLSSVNRLLTPREIQVAGHVRDGRTSKEIAEIISLSVAAVDFHRKNLRTKLGLAGTGANLRTYLLSLK